AGYRYARALQFGTKLGFLVVHVGADAAACERTDASTDQRVAASMAATRQCAGKCADASADRSTASGVGYLLFPGIGVGRGAGRKIGRAQRDDRNFLEHVIEVPVVSGDPSFTI